jgi:steroid delta-isomerase-like uncharacterized protein
MSTVNKALILRYITEVLNKGNTALIDELVAPSFLSHDPIGPDIHGPDGVKQRHAAYRAAFPDLQYTVEEIVAEDDIVVWRWTAHGTHLGEILGVAPTRKQATATGTVTFHVADGKLQETWVNWDALGLLRQLGALPQHP